MNFKNAGNGGFFNVFEVPQMENGWKMEKSKLDSSFRVLLRSRGEVRQVAFQEVGLSNASHKPTSGRRPAPVGTNPADSRLVPAASGS